MNVVKQSEKKTFPASVKGLLCLVATLLVLSFLFGLMPLMEGNGYSLTNGGFCYADFTNTVQAGTILFFVLFFLTLSTVLWLRIGITRFWIFYAAFFITWILWVPAASYGIATGKEINSPYMLIGAILGHGNALVNPILYGRTLFNMLRTEPDAKSNKSEDKEEQMV